MTKVYVLLQNKYEVMPAAVFSREEDAWAIIDNVKKSEWKDEQEAVFSVWEFDLDNHVGHHQMKPWEVRISKDSGKISSCVVMLSLYHPTEPEITEYDDFFAVISPISRDHAIKVAIEKREEWLRSQNPPNNQESES